MQFLNVFGVYSVINIALIIEKIGIVQFVYLLVQMIEFLWEPKKPRHSLGNFFPEFFSNYFIPIKKMEIVPNKENNKDVDDNMNKNNRNQQKLILQNESDNNEDNEDEVWSKKMNPLHFDIYSNNNSSRNSVKDVIKDERINKYQQENNMDKCIYIIEKIKYFLSTCLALSSIIFVGLCMSEGYSSFEASVFTQFALASVALFVVFYCEGECVLK